MTDTSSHSPITIVTSQLSVPILLVPVFTTRWRGDLEFLYNDEILLYDMSEVPSFSIMCHCDSFAQDCGMQMHDDMEDKRRKMDVWSQVAIHMSK